MCSNEGINGVCEQSPFGFYLPEMDVPLAVLGMAWGQTQPSLAPQDGSSALITYAILVHWDLSTESIPLSALSQACQNHPSFTENKHKGYQSGSARLGIFWLWETASVALTQVQAPLSLHFGWDKSKWWQLSMTTWRSGRGKAESKGKGGDRRKKGGEIKTQRIARMPCCDPRPVVAGSFAHHLWATNGNSSVTNTW